MPTSQIQRPRFFEEQYLSAADLTAAVDYGRAQLARFALGGHTWGIAMGLELRETPAAGGSVEIHILPGYAWDGFGRAVVVPAPSRLPAELFDSAFKFDPAVDAGGQGRLVQVWLRYDEVRTQSPRPGFEGCDDADRRSRIEETFRVEIGPKPAPADRHAKIAVGGTATDPDQALRLFDPAAPLVYDESVPHQALPGPEIPPRWLVPLGFVRWQPVQNAAGRFVPRVEAGPEKDSDKTRRVRRYVGLVAEELQAADGAIRLRDRAKDPTTSAFSAPTADLVWVEGHLRVEGDARVCGGDVDFRAANGADFDAPLRVRRRASADLASHTIEVLIGKEAQKSNRFAVGPLKADGTIDRQFVVVSSGDAGVGTGTPSNRLHVSGATGIRQNRLYLSGGDGWSSVSYNAHHDAANGAWVLPDPARKAMTIELDDAGGVPRLEVFSNLTADPAKWASHFRVSGDTGNVAMGQSGGAVAVGAAAPGPGLKLDVRGDFGRDEGAATVHLFGSRIGDVGGGTLFLRSGGDFVAFDGNDRVGVGLATPACRLHVADSVNAPAIDLAAHVAVVENTHGGTQADVLALKVGNAAAGGGNNFITCFAGNAAVGSIEGNGAGISLNSTSADFAECLPRLDPGEALAPGDVVGVFGGRVTKATAGAHHVAVIAGRPIVLGNTPPAERRHLYAAVAFVGQVRVRVRGPVREGDLVVPSGRNDGTGVAVPAGDAGAAACLGVVGTAWEAADGDGVNEVAAVVGLPALALQRALREQRREMAALRAEVREGRRQT